MPGADPQVWPHRRPLRLHERRCAPGALAFSNDGAWLAAGDWGGHVQLVRVKDASVTQGLEVAGDQSSTAVVAVQFCRVACCLVVGTGDGVVVRLEP